ncbi:MAG TPA: protein kinase [Gemmatimonadaceae bacterium]
MSEKTFGSVRDLFERALPLPPSQQADFVRATAPHADIADEVISLLSAYERSNGYFEQLSKDVVAPLLSAMHAGDTAEAQPDAGMLAHYEIIERVTDGGMGVVYKARDTRLRRMVALKCVPRRQTSNPGAHARLMAEARAASALDNPNIGVVYEIGEAPSDGAFISMAWYEGETLRAKIQRGLMPIDEVISIASQLGAALVAAHTAGIIHRDVKPANAIVTPAGVVKLLDFGIAQLMSAAADDNSIAGTIAYMSPEQTTKAKLDARTDIWSLGVVMYEMLTGRRPFRGPDEESLIDAIRNDVPAALALLRPDVPPMLATIVETCLKKSAAERYQTAEQLCVALKEHTTDREAYELYLKGRYAWGQRNRAGLQDALAYFSGALDRDPTFARAHAAMAEAYVNMSNFGYLPTSEALARAEVSANRAIALDTALAEAYTTRGFVRASRAAYAEAEKDFLKARSLNPSYAWNYHYYALLLTMLGRLDEASDSLRACIELDPLSLPANTTLAIVAMMQGCSAEARRQFEHALTLSRDFPLTLYYLGALSASEQRIPEAISLLEQALRLAPGFPGVRAALAYTCRLAERPADAQAITQAMEQSASDPTSVTTLALGYAVLGEHDKAFEMLETVRWSVPTLILLRADPLLARFRADPRYPQLLARDGLR